MEFVMTVRTKHQCLAVHTVHELDPVWDVLLLGFIPFDYFGETADMMHFDITLRQTGFAFSVKDSPFQLGAVFTYDLLAGFGRFRPFGEPSVRVLSGYPVVLLYT